MLILVTANIFFLPDSSVYTNINDIIIKAYLCLPAHIHVQMRTHTHTTMDHDTLSK